MLHESLRQFVLNHPLSQRTRTQFEAELKLFLDAHNYTDTDLYKWARDFNLFLLENRTFEPGLEFRAILEIYK